MQHQPTSYKDLPPECLLRIIDFLYLPDIAALLQTSTLWNSVIEKNERIIYYRIASTLEDPGSLPLESLEAVLKSWASPVAKRVKSWKQYCKDNNSHVVKSTSKYGFDRPTAN